MNRGSSQLRHEIFRPIQLVIVGGFGLVLVAILVLSWLTWREQSLLSKTHVELQRSVAFHERHRSLEQKLIGISSGSNRPAPMELVPAIDELIELCEPADVETPKHLVAFRGHLMEAENLDTEPMNLAFAHLHEVAISKHRREQELIAALGRETRSQLQLGLAAPLAIIALGAAFIPITRRRVMRPLEDFGRQISSLAKGDFRPTPPEQVSNLTLPLHRNFIKLAVRLQELEREHREREVALQEKVYAATAALLEQQHSLARAERLAATGELAASVAHEVRNPLAGIQMSLANLRTELENPEHVERVDILIGEVERLARLVNEIVDASRHAPETPSVVVVADLVDELLSLTRYQLPPEIELESRVREDLRCRIPKERLRQALLNLILNAEKAIGDEPGHIEVEITAEEDNIRIRVTDDGPGFPDELLASGVRPFYSTRDRGTGLGLAMVRRFVREAEGDLDLSNRRGEGERRGACVSLLLPSVVDHG
jgi:signal transduction histidine kinase